MSLFNIDPPELFKNIAQVEYGGKYYDFHNDFNCIKLLFEQGQLVIYMRHFITGLNVSIIFNDVMFTKFFFPFENTTGGSLTIDNLYRGRYEIEGNLFEYDERKRFYYYLEFYEGCNMEFFCGNLLLREE